MKGVRVGCLAAHTQVCLMLRNAGGHRAQWARIRTERWAWEFQEQEEREKEIQRHTEKRGAGSEREDRDSLAGKDRKTERLGQVRTRRKEVGREDMASGSVKQLQPEQGRKECARCICLEAGMCSVGGGL